MNPGILLSAAALAGLLATALLVTSCSHLPPGCTGSSSLAELAHQLRADVRHLAGDIGERNLYHPEKLEAAAAWIEGEFRRMGYQTVRRLPVAVRGRDYALPADVTAWNIEAVLPGTSHGGEQLVIGAHYDSKVQMPRWNAHWPPTPDLPGTPGANDNGSGVATVLALARRFVGHPQSRTLRFVAFVNEEPPFYQSEAMGSLAYARKLKADGFKKVQMITPETLGCYSVRPNAKRSFIAPLLGLPNRPDYVAFAGNHASRRWIAQCARSFAPHANLELRTLALPTLVKKVAWSDDWSFWQCGFQAFAVTDTAYGRSDQYHEVYDTPEKLDYGPMAGVVWALGGMVGEVADDPGAW